MSDSFEPDPDGTGVPAAAGTEALRADIEQARAELADTVEQVVDKLNPKTQASHAAHRVNDAAASHRTQIIAGTAAGVAALVLVRYLRRRSAR